MAAYVLAAVAWSAGATAQVPGADRLPPADTFSLPNGVRIAVARDVSAPVVAVSLWHDLRGDGAGSPSGARPGGERAAMARLVQMVRSAGEPGLSALELVGLVDAAGGDMWAEADRERAAFRIVVPSHRLDLALWLQGERMRPRAVQAALLESLRDLVLQDLRVPAPYRLDRRAEGVLDSLAAGGRDGSTDADGERLLGYADAEDVGAFARAWMGPGNATVVVAGDVTLDQVRLSAERWLGGVPGGSSSPAGEPDAERSGGERDFAPLPSGRADVTIPGRGPEVAIAWAVPPRGHPDRPAIEVLAPLLVSGLDAEPGIRSGVPGRGAGVSAAFRPGPEGGDLLVFRVRLVGGRSPEELEGLLLERLATMEREGVGRTELDRARRRALSTAAARILTVAGRAEALQREWLDQPGPPDPDAALSRLWAVTGEDVVRVVGSVLAPDRRIVVASSGLEDGP